MGSVPEASQILPAVLIKNTVDSWLTCWSCDIVDLCGEILSICTCLDMGAASSAA